MSRKMVCSECECGVDICDALSDTKRLCCVCWALEQETETPYESMCSKCSERVKEWNGL